MCEKGYLPKSDVLILEKLGQVPNDLDSHKAPQICLGLVVKFGYPGLGWLNPVPVGTYKCHSIHCNLPNSDPSSIRTLSMTQVKDLSKAASVTLDPIEGYTSEDIKMATNITQLCGETKGGREDNDNGFFMTEIYDSLLGGVCLPSAAD